MLRNTKGRRKRPKKCKMVSTQSIYVLLVVESMPDLSGEPQSKSNVGLGAIIFWPLIGLTGFAMPFLAVFGCFDFFLAVCCWLFWPGDSFLWVPSPSPSGCPWKHCIVGVKHQHDPKIKIQFDWYLPTSCAVGEILLVCLNNCRWPILRNLLIVNRHPWDSQVKDWFS